MSKIQPTQIDVNCTASSDGVLPAHRMVVWQWGERDSSHVVVCAHGLTRQGRDFDALVRQLLARDPSVTVWCPDMAGRGQSEWLPNATGYQIPYYVGDMLQCLGERHARCPIHRLDWIGTSMGGVMGLIMAAQPQAIRPFPLDHLVLNDVGPSLPWAFVERLCTYVGQPMVFESPEAAAPVLRELSVGFGPHSDEDWLALTRPMLRPRAQGGYSLHYDPAIVEPIRQLTPEALAQSESLLWSLYDQIKCPTLLLRGVESDVLTIQTAQAMTQRGPRARLVEFAGVGHAPTLVDPAQASVVLDWLQG